MNKKEKIIYFLGKEFRIVRFLYVKITNGHYLWSISQSLIDSQSRLNFFNNKEN